MKSGLHPNNVPTVVTCTCGATYKVHSTKAKMHIDICGNCHPFYTGKQRFADSGGRVERFRRKYARVQEQQAAKTGR